MPKKTKELDNEPVKKDNTISVAEEVTKKTTTKEVSTKTPKSTTKKTTARTSKSATKKATTRTAKSTEKTSKTKTTGTAKKSQKKLAKKELVSIIEYYDLPYRYNQTIVKILAQTPQMLFVYWDISDDDRATFEEHYGKDFFSQTKPVLIVHNRTMNYSFEIEINDFANSWYLHINDANCKYEIELGRRPYMHISNIQEQYIYVSSSNQIDAPNNHILFEKFNPTQVIYKNTKSGATVSKDFSTISNYKNMQKIYNIYDLYKQIYKNELLGEISTTPTNPSSIFKNNK